MSFKSKLSYIKNPLKITRTLGQLGLLNWLPDESYLKLAFRGEMNKRLNLDHPQTFNEKLQWLKLNDRNPLYTTLVDKYEVRDYIRDKIGEQYLIPLINAYHNVEEINWDQLPRQFVLKCTHASGTNIICTDKERLDTQDSKIKLNNWLKKNYFWHGREWPYKDVVPRIVCEVFISEDHKVPNDYKLLCFNGKVKLIEVHIDRFNQHKQDFYDLEWKKMNISQGAAAYDISDSVIEKPRNLDLMIQLSERLAADMRHVRVDWYAVNEKLYFGEMTFFDGSGLDAFDHEEDDYLLGSWINLNQN